MPYKLTRPGFELRGDFMYLPEAQQNGRLDVGRYLFHSRLVRRANRMAHAAMGAFVYAERL
jgi:hypothetical protein